MSATDEILAAVRAGDADSVRRLIGTDSSLVNAKDESGIPALLLATYYGRNEISGIFIEQGAELDIFSAAALGNESLVRELFHENHELVNSYSPDGFTPLGLAAFFGRVGILNLLIEAGADVNATSRNHMRVRPLHSAVAHRQADAALAMAKSLLSHGADVRVAQEGGWTPLHQAAAHGPIQMIELLLSHGAEVNAVSEDGRTPLRMAAENKHEEIAALLRQRGAREGETV